MFFDYEIMLNSNLVYRKRKSAVTSYNNNHVMLIGGRRVETGNK